MAIRSMCVHSLYFLAMDSSGGLRSKELNVDKETLITLLGSSHTAINLNLMPNYSSKELTNAFVVWYHLQQNSTQKQGVRANWKQSDVKCQWTVHVTETRKPNNKQTTTNTTLNTKQANV